MSIPEIGQSFGMEIEFLHPLQTTTQTNKELLDVGVNTTYDASTETIMYILRRSRLTIIDSPKNLFLDGSKIKCGGELVSKIWNNRDPRDSFRRIAVVSKVLAQLGEEHKNTRAGIHFHVSYAPTLESLKSVLLLASHLEKFFFIAGGMGYEHRGMSGDSVYYRPITKSGPLAVPVPGGWAHVFNVRDMLNAISIEDFFTMYGDSWRMSGTRYVPVRYHWLNLLNLVTKSQGTVEFRVFNFSLDALKIWAMQQVCMKFVQYCISATPERLVKDNLYVQQSVFDDIPLEQTISTFENFAIKTELDDRVTELVLNMLAHSKRTILTERIIRSHLHDRHTVYVHWEDEEKYSPDRVSSSKVEHPIYSDKYTLDGLDPNSRSLSRLRRDSVRSL